VLKSDLPKSGEMAVSSIPVGHPPPAPPAKLSSIPPKVVDLAQEKEVVKKDEKPKGTMLQRGWATAKKEAAHYWAGTKLLGSEIKISSKLAWKVLNGSTLTRRERRQVRHYGCSC
jgi:LETM1 and EF-hand domain-containing protein 1